MTSTNYTNTESLPGSRRHIASEEDAGSRLDKFLSELPGIASREMARRLILQGAVRLNGEGGEPSSRLREGDEILYSIPPPEPVAIPAQHLPLDVFYEDRWLIVVDKPAGVAMHPGPGHREGTMVNFLLGHCGDLSGIGGRLRPGIVHRLDKDTSGLIVAAKNDEAHLHLAGQFKAHSIQRIYQALVVGRPPNEQGTIDLPLARHRDNRLLRTVAEHGKRAVTHWRLMQRLGPFSLLQARLETGRTHQIRVHLAHQGMPVLGDPLYGKARHRGLKLHPELMERLEQLDRQALHACELGFNHPATDAPLHFASPYPPDMQAILQALVRHSPE